MSYLIDGSCHPYIVKLEFCASYQLQPSLRRNIWARYPCIIPSTTCFLVTIIMPRQLQREEDLQGFRRPRGLDWKGLLRAGRVYIWTRCSTIYSVITKRDARFRKQSVLNEQIKLRFIGSSLWQVSCSKSRREEDSRETISQWQYYSTHQHHCRYFEGLLALNFVHVSLLCKCCKIIDPSLFHHASVRWPIDYCVVPFG